MKSLNDLKDRAYKCAVVHGWHEENLSNEHFLCLVISELTLDLHPRITDKIERINL